MLILLKSFPSVNKSRLSSSYLTSSNWGFIFRDQAVSTSLHLAYSSWGRLINCKPSFNCKSSSVMLIPFRSFLSSKKNRWGTSPLPTTWNASITLLKPMLTVFDNNSSWVHWLLLYKRHCSKLATGWNTLLVIDLQMFSDILGECYCKFLHRYECFLLACKIQKRFS